MSGRYLYSFEKNNNFSLEFSREGTLIFLRLKYYPISQEKVQFLNFFLSKFGKLKKLNWKTNVSRGLDLLPFDMSRKIIYPILKGDLNWGQTAEDWFEWETELVGLHRATKFTSLLKTILFSSHGKNENENEKNRVTLSSSVVIINFISYY